METETPTVTNAEFAEAVGCHFTMASRLRNGQRVPSAGLLGRIVAAYPLTPEELVAMLESLDQPTPEKAAAAFGQWITRCIFERPTVAA